MRRGICLLSCAGAGLALVPAIVRAGPYSSAQENVVPGAIDPGIPGIMEETVNPAFTGWASRVISYLPGPNVDPGWNDPTLSLGPVTGDNFHIVSLGESTSQPGRITLAFDGGIRNSAGPDFAVFENGFGTDTFIFGELAYVEVSSDGANFARFHSTSLTPASDGAFGSINPTNVHNLAGKHANDGGYSYGTPFDLSDLAGNPLVQSGAVNLRAIQYVRLIDIAGNGSSTDSSNRPIYDAYPTVGSPGFDLEAIGVLNSWWGGDANFDGVVDADDLGLLAQNWQGSGRTFQQGDFTGDGLVDVRDLSILASHWFQTDLSSPGGAPIPEPSGAVLLVTLGGLFVRRRSHS